MNREKSAAAVPGRGKQRRRRLLLLSAAPVLVAVALAVKLLSVGYLGSEAAASFGRGDQAGTASAASGLDIANFVERHKAPFAAGDALVLSGDFTGARARFEASLADAPPADECKVRVNLVLSIERLADAAAAAADATAATNSAQSAADAARLYDDGLAVIRAAPPGCFSPDESKDNANGAEGEGDRLRGAEERLQSKAGKLGGAAPDAETGDVDKQPQPDPEPQQSQLDKLEESAKSAQRERNGGRQREEYLGNTDAGSGTDRPW
ncbi:hypothetical protein ASF98_07910 [Arthrobacter sp. Leaf337]|uniref:hypothetical protein n=1 Tax=Arthrobacter sp. Leaf337 TaxID=1736342 RepID=UPI0006F210BD|nr:hypothetical protein [Arthrobacter sp. Leaf337]KQR68555.1 hypothetical protein ASF98_07910 [Arthrobacter sp. Leaf337]